jgi:periplasmic protein TonB
MKRNEKMVPGFDEIIFRNRNMEYGAYDLRRRYKSAASFSIMGVSAFFILLILLIYNSMPKDASAEPDRIIFISVTPERLIDPNNLVRPEVKRPVSQPDLPKYVPPKVVDDSVNTANTMMTNDLASTFVKNGIVTENVDSVMKDIAPDPVKSDEIFFSSQEPPIFPGGPAALQKYIVENTKYPQEAIEINLQGRVIVKFAVMSDGSVSRVEILRGINPLLDQEAARVVSTLPKWKPAKQNGIPVSLWFTVPVTFQLNSY